MNFLMLRGQVPQDRSPSEIVFDSLEKVDDLWTHLFYNLLASSDYGELWYWGGKRKKQFKSNFIERWVPSFSLYKSNFIPDIIFCRGGFSEYNVILKKFPNAFKIYYGAGIRFLPQDSNIKYDLVLVDSFWQKEQCYINLPKQRCELFIKPAPDSLFWPRTAKNTYDICFPADGSTKRKGHAFVYSTLPSSYNVLNLGSPYRWCNKPNNVVSYRVLKSKLPFEFAKCKVGIITSTVNSGGGLDSCPRVLPEMLACGLPLVVLDETLFWSEKYITNSTGVIASRKNFWEKVDFVLNNVEKFSVREYYINNLSLSIAAKFLRSLICI